MDLMIKKKGLYQEFLLDIMALRLIKKNVSIEAKIISTNIDRKFTDNNIKTKTYSLILNYLWY